VFETRESAVDYADLTAQRVTGRAVHLHTGIRLRHYWFYCDAALQYVFRPVSSSRRYSYAASSRQGWV